MENEDILAVLLFSWRYDLGQF